VQEEIVLSTCNRLEVLAVLNGKENSISGVKTLLAETGQMKAEELASCLYVYEEEAACAISSALPPALTPWCWGNRRSWGR